MDPSAGDDPAQEGVCFVCGFKSGLVLACDVKGCDKVFHVQCLGCTMPPEADKWYCPRHSCAVCGLQDRMISRSETAMVQCPSCFTAVCPNHFLAWTEAQKAQAPAVGRAVEAEAAPPPSPSRHGAAANGRRQRGRATFGTTADCNNCACPTPRVALAKRLESAWCLSALDPLVQCFLSPPLGTPCPPSSPGRPRCLGDVVQAVRMLKYGSREEALRDMKDVMEGYRSVCDSTPSLQPLTSAISHTLKVFEEAVSGCVSGEVDEGVALTSEEAAAAAAVAVAVATKAAPAPLSCLRLFRPELATKGCGSYLSFTLAEWATRVAEYDVPQTQPVASAPVAARASASLPRRVVLKVEAAAPPLRLPARPTPTPEADALRASARNQSKPFRLAKHHQFSGDAMREFVEGPSHLPLSAAEQRKRGADALRPLDPCPFDGALAASGEDFGQESGSRSRSRGVRVFSSSVAQGEEEETALTVRLPKPRPSPTAADSESGEGSGREEEEDGDWVGDEEAAEALGELETLDVDEGVDNLWDLLPPSEAEVSHLFNEMSTHLLRTLRANALLRSAWAQSRRAMCGDLGAGVITLGEGRLLQELRLENSQLKMEVQALREQLAAGRQATPQPPPGDP